jgi:hypothetical protein
MSTILNRSYHLIWDLFDLKGDFLRNGKKELNVSQLRIEGSANYRLIMILSTLFTICCCLKEAPNRC